MGRTGKTALAALAALAVLGIASLAPAQGAGFAIDDISDWHFTHQDRHVKVVLLAGSIGAFRDQPYGRLLHERCANAEVRNLSQVGQGAPALLSSFRRDVLENSRLPIGAQSVEMWLMFGGGLNSVGAPQVTNRAMRRLFELAHRRHFGVVALTLTPWGSEDDHGRWNGARGLHVMRSTRMVVDFVLGRLTPANALGNYASERRDVATPDAPWLPAERPDVSIDLYDSVLRDRNAQPWPIDRVRESLRRDPSWQRNVAQLAPNERDARLESDARALADAPRWFLRPEYRGFDHIHPNREGHRAIADIACPALPRSWGCQCPRAAQ
jgi:hypothetical protein